MAKLDVKALGLTLGIIWAGAIFIMGMAAMLFNYGAGFIAAIGRVYIGTNATILGILIGVMWGFVDAGIGGVLIALLYNKLSK